MEEMGIKMLGKKSMLGNVGYFSKHDLKLLPQRPMWQKSDRVTIFVTSCILKNESCFGNISLLCYGNMCHNQYVTKCYSFVTEDM